MEEGFEPRISDCPSHVIVHCGMVHELVAKENTVVLQRGTRDEVDITKVGGILKGVSNLPPVRRDSLRAWLKDVKVLRITLSVSTHRHVLREQNVEATFV